jgi:two-component system, response regulator
MNIRPAHPILIVEDSDEDYFATFRALRKSGLANPVFRCEDGDDALAYLFRQGRYSDSKTSPRPGIILLDLNLPGTDGEGVLAEIKQDAVLKKIPVIMLTTSDDERDVERCYAKGANSYIRKPVDMKGFMDAIQRLRDYWFEIVLLPKNE